VVCPEVSCGVLRFSDIPVPVSFFNGRRGHWPPKGCDASIARTGTSPSRTGNRTFAPVRSGLVIALTIVNVNVNLYSASLQKAPLIHV